MAAVSVHVRKRHPEGVDHRVSYFVFCQKLFLARDSNKNTDASFLLDQGDGWINFFSRDVSVPDEGKIHTACTLMNLQDVDLLEL